MRSPLNAISLGLLAIVLAVCESYSQGWARWVRPCAKRAFGEGRLQS